MHTLKKLGTKQKMLNQKKKHETCSKQREKYRDISQHIHIILNVDRQSGVRLNKNVRHNYKLSIRDTSQIQLYEYHNYINNSIDFMMRNITKDKEHFVMTKGTMQPGRHNNYRCVCTSQQSPKYMKQHVTELKRERGI